ncbi:MAG TPA: Asp-tRNA(Asn)/Glu-tRNA(Gln) amidotransferase subunit GatB [Candidatus Dormibacteraeota bacterium]|nr:Asp-tRNA(Asn)/Glu-tRNA(Gln) amidotransferase subunit GatB [Candidatus Dormibacteraeota bacterium]
MTASSTLAATDFEAVIGLEVHAELLTQSKMFCSCSAAYLAGEPNSHVCPVCLGLPGALPVINERALKMTIRTGLALDCEIPAASKFDRKNYFYPDLPKGYQISQYDLPLCVGGHLDVTVDGAVRRVGITRVHLEEDTGKLTHSGAIHTSRSSLVDLNRAGVPLIEIVSEPDMRGAAEAREYMQRLRQLLVWIGVSDGRMEEGSLRCDANVSVRPRGATELGVKVEVKNMNSFRAVHLALEHEIERQVAAVLAGEAIVQETRGWNEAKGVTVGQRSKEYAHDYRYFPEPDLPPLEITRELVERITGELPELPAARAARLVAELGLPAKEADLLTSTAEMADFFEAVTAEDVPAKEAANWMLGEVSRVLNDGAGLVGALRVRPAALAALIRRKLDGTLSNNQAKGLFAALAAGDSVVDGAGEIDREIEARGLRQVSDEGRLAEWVDAAIAAEPQAAEDFRAGNDRAVGRLVGAVMRASGGKASGPAVDALLRQRLRP